jgi:hypothetical protein
MDQTVYQDGECEVMVHREVGYEYVYSQTSLLLIWMDENSKIGVKGGRERD